MSEMKLNIYWNKNAASYYYATVSDRPGQNSTGDTQDPAIVDTIEHFRYWALSNAQRAIGEANVNYFDGKKQININHSTHEVFVEGDIKSDNNGSFDLPDTKDNKSDTGTILLLLAAVGVAAYFLSRQR